MRDSRFWIICALAVAFSLLMNLPFTPKESHRDKRPRPDPPRVTPYKVASEILTQDPDQIRLICRERRLYGTKRMQFTLHGSPLEYLIVIESGDIRMAPAVLKILARFCR